MNEHELKWARRWIALADLVASWSPDQGTKCGAVIVDDDDKTVLATGYNGMPRGVETDYDSRWVRPEKYKWVEHAERNAIYNAARSGGRTKGCTMYLNYAPECCADCVRAIIQSGIERLVGPNRDFPGKGAGTHYDTAEVAEELRGYLDVEYIEMPDDYVWLSHIPEDERK